MTIGLAACLDAWLLAGNCRKLNVSTINSPTNSMRVLTLWVQSAWDDLVPRSIFSNWPFRSLGRQPFCLSLSLFRYICLSLLLSQFTLLLLWHFLALSTNTDEQKLNIRQQRWPSLCHTFAGLCSNLRLHWLISLVHTSSTERELTGEITSCGLVRTKTWTIWVLQGTWFETSAVQSGEVSFLWPFRVQQS